MNSILIGNNLITQPVILAPMSGVTDMPFRKLVKKFGVGLVVSEMIASRAMILETRQSLQKCAISEEENNTSVQLAGCEPDIMAEAAKLNENKGAKIIDINFGCPVKKVVGGNAGSSLMRDETLAARIMEATVKAVKIPVTVKMRMGWDHNNLNAPKLAKIAENCGIQMVTVHGRTRCQFYKGKADWDFIKNVKDNISIPVIANGDIKTFKDVEMCMQASYADGIMIGRGVYGKPWLIQQIIHYLETGERLPAPDLNTQLNIVLEHYDDIINLYGETTGVRMARKHIGWYSNGLPNSVEFRSKINQSTNTVHVRDMILEFYNTCIDQ
ncbi:MAG: tRNA dihydrouridine synthase DusB [Rickettsiales endosymbiont of Dermacentor nuttalli]